MRGAASLALHENLRAGQSPLRLRRDRVRVGSDDDRALRAAGRAHRREHVREQRAGRRPHAAPSAAASACGSLAGGEHDRETGALSSFESGPPDWPGCAVISERAAAEKAKCADESRYGSAD